MHCPSAIARAMPRCIRAGTGNVLRFYVNSTRQTSNLARKKSTIPQDYFASLIPCGKRGAKSRNLTNSELWTIYNFPAKTSIYNVKRQRRAMRCQCRCQARRPGEMVQAETMPAETKSNECFKRAFQAGDPMQVDDSKRLSQTIVSSVRFKRVFQ